MHTQIYVLIALLCLSLAVGLIVMHAPGAWSLVSDDTSARSERLEVWDSSEATMATETSPSAKMQENVSESVAKSVAQSEECDYELLKQQAETVIAETEFDGGYWTRTEEAAIEEPYQYGWIGGTDIELSACGYLITYSSLKNKPLKNDLSKNLRSKLKELGWEDKPYQTSTSDGAGESVTISLAHAGGPMGDVTVFVLPLYQDRSIQFARIVESNPRMNWPDYMDGKIDSPCPCWQEVKLSVSAPVSLAPFFE